MKRRMIIILSIAVAGAAFGQAPMAPDLLGTGRNTGFQDPSEDQFGEYLPISGFEESENIWIGYDQLTERSVPPDQAPPESYVSNFVFTNGAIQQRHKWVKPSQGHSYAIPEEGPKQGDQALLWADTTKTSRLVAYNVPRDWSSYKYLSFWVHSATANGAGIAIAVYSDDSEKTPKDDDYYQAKFILDFSGWKLIEIPLEKFQITRNPRGLGKIDYIKLASSGFSLVSRKDTRLYLDDMRLTRKTRAVDPLDLMRLSFPDRQHPYLYGDADFFADLKRKIADYPWAQAAFAAVKRSADALFGKVVPEAGGGFYHDVTGTTGDAAVSDEHYAIARGVRACGLMFQLTGEARYAQKAKEVLLTYASYYLNYPLRDKYGNSLRSSAAGSARALPQPMNESRWAVYLAWGMDLVWSELSQEERDTLEIDLFRQVANLVKLNNEKGHNHQSWHNAGVGVIGLLFRDESYVKYAIYGTDCGFIYQMKASVTPDGMWYEGSGHYHFYTMEPLIMLSEAARNAGILDPYDLGQPYGKAYESMFLFPAEYRTPSFELPLINDGKRVVLTDDERARFLELGYARFASDPAAAAIAPILSRSPRLSLEALLFGADELPPVEAEALESANLGGNIAVLRSPGGRLMMTLNGRAYTGGHSHMDKLSTTTFADGRAVSPDAGSVKYGMVEYKDYFVQTAAHNTVAVDGSSQKFVSSADLLAFSAGPLVQAAAMRDSSCNPGSVIERGLFMTDRYALDLFAASSDESRSYRWIYRGLGELRPPAGPELSPAAFAPPPMGQVDAFRYFESVRAAPAGAAPSLAWDLGGGGGFALHFLGGVGARLFTADMPQAKPVDDEIDPVRMRGVVLEREGLGKTLFAALHVPLQGKMDYELEPGELRELGGQAVGAADPREGAIPDPLAGTFSVLFGGTRDQVVYNAGTARPLAAKGILTDAKVLLARRVDGALSDIFMYGGSIAELPEGNLHLSKEDPAAPMERTVIHVRVSEGRFEIRNHEPGARVRVRAGGSFADMTISSEQGALQTRGAAGPGIEFWVEPEAAR